MSFRKSRVAAFAAASALSILLAFVGPSPGQVPAVVPPPPGSPPETVPPLVGPPPKPFSDPTQPDPRLKEILNPARGPALGPGAHVKQAELRLKGRVILKDRAAVILDIDGQSYMLPVGGEARSIRVKAITPEGVTVEVGSAKDVRVLY